MSRAKTRTVELSFNFIEDPKPHRPCDYPGCGEHGEHRAPKSRDSLNDYYWYCLEHVRDYNTQWDFYRGMSPDDIERAMRDDVTWNRPTWSFNGKKVNERASILDRLRAYFGPSFFSEDSRQHRQSFTPQDAGMLRELKEAIITMEMHPSNDMRFSAIQRQYRILARQYHPDNVSNQGQSDERMKKINQAYAVVKHHKDLFKP